MGAIPTSSLCVVSSTALTKSYQWICTNCQAVTASIAIATTTLVHGDIVTLIGGGGVAPATLSSGVTDKSALLKRAQHGPD
jgi:hypothetical protein